MGNSSTPANQHVEPAAPSLTSSAYKAILEQLQEGVIIVSLDGSFRRMNHTAAKMYGFDKPSDFEKLLPRIDAVLELRTYPDRKLLKRSDWPISHLQRGAKMVRDTHYVKRLDNGHEAIIEYVGKLVRADSQPGLAVLTLHDVTLQRRTKRAQDAFFETALDAIVVIDHKGMVTEFNPAAERAFGYQRSEILGKEMARFIIPPKYRGAHRRGLARLLKTGHGPLIGRLTETTAIRRDGSEFPVELSIAQIGNDNPPSFMGTLRDITERKRHETELRRSEENFRVLANNMSQLAWICGPDGSRTWFNRRWYEYTGTTFEAMRGMGWQNVHHPEHVKGVLKRFFDCIKRGAEWEDTFPLRGKDGAYRWFLTRAVPIRNDDGQILRWFGTNTDIEDVRRRKELEYETAKLVEVNHAKDEFIALASHQLRTPATGVKQYIGMLLQGYFGELNDAQREVVQTAYNSNEWQLDVINALLNVARLDAGKVTLKREPCRIKDLVYDVIRDQSEAFQLRNQTLISHLKPVSAHIDARLVRMVLENVIDNAGKYTPEHKTVTVRLSGTAKAVTIAVTDEGVGISKRDQTKLFQKFSRIDNDLSTAANGSGLGLYWAKKIVDLHGGTINVASKARHGSTFTITLPRQ